MNYDKAGKIFNELEILACKRYVDLGGTIEKRDDDTWKIPEPAAEAVLYALAIYLSYTQKGE